MIFRFVSLGPFRRSRESFENSTSLLSSCPILLSGRKSGSYFNVENMNGMLLFYEKKQINFLGDINNIHHNEDNLRGEALNRLFPQVIVGVDVEVI